MNSFNPTLPNWLSRCAERVPDHLAVRCETLNWTFAELDQQASYLALQLATFGAGERSRVALVAANGPAYVACVHALTRLGAVLVPLNTRLTLEELRWQVQDVQATFLLYDERYAGLANAIMQDMPRLRCIKLLAQASSVLAIASDEKNQGLRSYEELSISAASLRTVIDLDAPQVIMYTSGTTGHPKGVIITYGMQWWNAISSALNLGHRSDDCWLACLPLFHIGGLSILMRSVIYGISVIVQERFDAVAVNRAICEDGVTIVSAVAVMLQRMLSALDKGRAGYPSTLRCVLLGGGPAPRTLLEECTWRNIPVAQTYGLTESCSQAATLSPWDALRKPGSAGQPLLPVQLRIVCDGRPAAPGEHGVIFLKGPTITPGYVDRPVETAQALRDGWLCTGDIGYLDADGYLYVLDRRADLIISGGENIYPAEIENVLLSHSDVEEAGVCGLSDPQWGQIPIAFIQARIGSTIDADSLLAYASQRLARYKLPRAIHFVDQLPRNAAGKLLRRELPHML